MVIYRRGPTNSSPNPQATKVTPLSSSPCSNCMDGLTGNRYTTGSTTQVDSLEVSIPEKKKDWLKFGKNMDWYMVKPTSYRQVTDKLPTSYRH